MKIICRHWNFMAVVFKYKDDIHHVLACNIVIQLFRLFVVTEKYIHVLFWLSCLGPLVYLLKMFVKLFVFPV